MKNLRREQKCSNHELPLGSTDPYMFYCSGLFLKHECASGLGAGGMTVFFSGIFKSPVASQASVFCLSL